MKTAKPKVVYPPIVKHCTVCRERFEVVEHGDRRATRCKAHRTTLHPGYRTKSCATCGVSFAVASRSDCRASNCAEHRIKPRKEPLRLTEKDCMTCGSTFPVLTQSDRMSVYCAEHRGHKRKHRRTGLPALVLPTAPVARPVLVKRPEPLAHVVCALCNDTVPRLKAIGGLCMDCAPMGMTA